MVGKRKAKPGRKGPRIPPKSVPTRTRAPASPKFVGRDASLVLDKYPAKDPATLVKGPPSSAAIPAAPPGTPATSAPSKPSAPEVSAPISLISLERPFDVDEFAQMLGETSLRVTVPREDLVEVLRRIVEFMSFGIYVYRLSFWPARSDLLKEFVVELQRVDYSPGAGDWIAFEERGRSESPFGPDGTR